MKTKELVFNAILIGMIFIMAWIPQLGYIQIFPTVGITIIHIPVLIGALVYKRSGVILGTAFGLSSLLIAFVRPVTPVDLLFQNPLVSVLPRVIFGYAIYYIYVLFKSLFKERNVSNALTMFTATMLHSVLVLFMIYIFGVDLLGGNQVALGVIGGILITNASIEALVATVVGTIIVNRLHAFIG